MTQILKATVAETVPQGKPCGHWKRSGMPCKACRATPGVDCPT